MVVIENAAVSALRIMASRLPLASATEDIPTLPEEEVPNIRKSLAKKHQVLSLP